MQCYTVKKKITKYPLTQLLIEGSKTGLIAMLHLKADSM